MNRRGRPVRHLSCGILKHFKHRYPIGTFPLQPEQESGQTWVFFDQLNDLIARLPLVDKRHLDPPSVHLRGLNHTACIRKLLFVTFFVCRDGGTYAVGGRVKFVRNTRKGNYVTVEKFAAAVEALIREAKEGGLPHDTLLVEIEHRATAEVRQPNRNRIGLEPARNRGISAVDAGEFSAAVEALIGEAKAKGLSNDTLLIELEDIISLLREGLL
jgi:hypothetical protein